ncbi:MAG: hypothetical protein ACREFP_07245 [Acetobacteraceae bacterium]
MTIQRAILIGAAIVGAAIICGRVVAPYQIASGTAVVWRINTLTGTVRLCNDIIYAGKGDGLPRCR